MENMASAPPVYILGAHCEPNPEYVKRRNAFRLRTQDGAEYLFATGEEKAMHEWIAKIRFHASLTPSDQLKSFELVCIRFFIQKLDYRVLTNHRQLTLRRRDRPWT